ncbi:MAG: zf-HC2 domain-containing protein [Leeuwenhoekiella sp.]
MNTQHISDFLPDYLDNNLDKAERQNIEQHLEQCAICRTELAELKALFTAFSEESIPQPSAAVSSNFYKMLEDEKSKDEKVILLKAKQKPGKIWLETLKIAASIAIIAGSFLLGKYQEKSAFNSTISALETKNQDFKQTAMLSLMENQSASKRIQGVNYIEQFKEPDPAIVNALIGRMQHDDNANVRLAATEALEKFTASENVKDAYIKALETESDPSLQIKIIQILVKIQEKKAVKPMQRLLDTDDTQPFVKDQIKSLMPGIL